MQGVKDRWLKKMHLSFSPLIVFIYLVGSKLQYQVHKYALPGQTSTKGWREMQPKDVDAVHELLSRFLERYDIAPVYSRDYIRHWFVPEVA